MKPTCLIVAALPAEARPLIDHWRLKREPNSNAFAIYSNDQRSPAIHLVVSGTGKINAAAACAHLYMHCRPAHACWLNIGIAGHAARDVGTALLVHYVVDSAS